MDAPCFILAGILLRADFVMPVSQPAIVLASSSVWRRQLIERFGLAFEAISPDIDESPGADEAADALALRLARTKAERIAHERPEAIVIGSDQVAHVAGRILGKPGTAERAREQLRLQSGKRVDFHTGLCVCAPGLATPRLHLETVTTRFRDLSDDEIARYVATEDVIATAGSVKSEGLGITLVEAVESRDPTALIGLPLIALRRLLAEAGIALP